MPITLRYTEVLFELCGRPISNVGTEGIAITMVEQTFDFKRNGLPAVDCILLEKKIPFLNWKLLKGNDKELE